jgi:hypothetical protein
MKVTRILPEGLEQIWPQIEGYMQKAAKYTYGRFEAEDIKQGLLTKPQQLWIPHTDTEIYGIVVTEITHYPRMSALTVHFLAGKNFNKWKDITLERVQKFGRDSGCQLIDSYGRDGWEKVWANYGFKKRFMFYELPLEN